MLHCFYQLFSCYSLLSRFGKNSNCFDYGFLKVQLVRSLDEARRKAGGSIKSKSVSLVRDSETSTDAGPLPCNQQKGAGGVPYKDFTEKPSPCRYRTEADVPDCVTVGMKF